METVCSSIINTMNEVIDRPDVKTKKLAEIICLAAECREGLYDCMSTPKEVNIEGIIWDAEEFTKVLVRANYKAQTMVNPGIEMPSLEEQIAEAMQEPKLVKFRQVFEKEEARRSKKS